MHIRDPSLWLSQPPPAKAVRLEEKIVKLKAQMKELQAIEIQLNESPGKQVSLTDPGARSMMTRGTGIVGYNMKRVMKILGTTSINECAVGQKSLALLPIQQARSLAEGFKASVIICRFCREQLPANKRRRRATTAHQRVFTHTGPKAATPHDSP